MTKTNDAFEIIIHFVMFYLLNFLIKAFQGKINDPQRKYATIP